MSLFGIVGGQQASVAETPDPDFANVVTLVHANGPNNSTNIFDRAPTPKVWTANGNAKLSTAQQKFGSASMVFDGTGDYFSAPNTSDFDFGSGDWTLELFARFPTLSGNGMLFELANGSASAANYALQIMRVTTGIQAVVTDGAIYYGSGSAGTVSLNTWHYIVFKRNGTSLTTQIDTTVVKTTNIGTITLGNPSGATAWIGSGKGPFAPLDGFIDELRVTKGVARTTTSVPTVPFSNS